MNVASSAESVSPALDGTASAASFAIATTLKQSLAHTKAFLHYHLNLKPDLFILFFDDPNDPAADEAAKFERTLVLRCDQAHWQRVNGGLPGRMQDKQIVNLNAALEICRERRIAWLISIDADELIYPRGIDKLRRELALLPPGKDVLTLEPLEAVRHRSLPDNNEPFSAVYHRVWPKSRRCLFKLIARPDLKLTHLGFFAHSRGKAFHRVGAITSINSQHGDENAIADGRRHRSRAAFLLHHDCACYSEWRLKWSRRISNRWRRTSPSSKERKNQYDLIEMALTRGGEEALRELYRSWFEYSMPTIQLYRCLGFIKAIKIDRRVFNSVI